MHDIYDNDFDKAFDEAVDAIEKKEHRLIWADKLKQHYAWWGNDGAEYRERKADFDVIIDLQPTVEVVPAEDYRSMEQTVYKLTQALAEAEPTKHGRWKHHQYGNTEGYYECDNCGKINSYKSNYCPNCGARMDEVSNDRNIG